MFRTVLLAICLFVTVSLSAREKIYGVMVTGKDDFHYQLALLSVESFLEQSYPDKELIIVNDGSYRLNIDDPRVREIHLNKKLTLGELRNVGLDALPKNALWIQWDDDDWHHPHIIEKQHEVLKKRKADLVYLKNQVQYCVKINGAWTKSGLIHGTILCRNKPDIRYPKQRKGEDALFLSEYLKRYRVVGWNNPPYYYLRFIHGHNTWDEDHFHISNRENDTWLVDEPSVEYLSQILPKYAFN